MYYEGFYFIQKHMFIVVNSAVIMQRKCPFCALQRLLCVKDFSHFKKFLCFTIKVFHEIVNIDIQSGLYTGKMLVCNGNLVKL